MAIERVTGRLHGRSGSFILQHHGIMARGVPQLSITVIPDSGTGELVGLTGTMAISIVDGHHTYDFEYRLDEGGSLATGIAPSPTHRSRSARCWRPAPRPAAGGVPAAYASSQPEHELRWQEVRPWSRIEAQSASSQPGALALAVQSAGSQPAVSRR